MGSESAGTTEPAPQVGTTLLRIGSARFIAGAEVVEDTVTYAAPIIRYMQGWKLGKVLAYCRGKGWSVEVR